MSALAAEHGIGVLAQYRGAALGLVALGTGRAAEALEHLEPVAVAARRAGQLEPRITQWPADHLEAVVRARPRADAEAALDELAPAAAAGGWTAAVHLRCRALLADEDRYDALFARAVELHEEITAPFERGRAHLCWGQRLRRDGRRVDARGRLRTALEVFEALGAQPWAELARRELRASGETLRPRGAAATDQLTPQELQIAMLVARGASNKDVAGSMFLSPKTIEAHLSRIYRKLDVRSRTQLAHRIGAGAAEVQSR
jgi:DNA-binding CsgD family transcriptional regulator